MGPHIATLYFETYKISDPMQAVGECSSIAMLDLLYTRGSWRQTHLHTKGRHTHLHRGGGTYFLHGGRKYCLIKVVDALKMIAI